MRIVIYSFLFALFAVGTTAGQSCAEKAREIKPQLSKETSLRYSENLEIAARNAVSNPSAENVIWYARRKGYLGHYKDAIDSLTISLPKFPGDARLYRHRGHRYITLRCFDDAIKDFQMAAKLVKGTPDEVEPDGLPNAKNIPTGTLQSNIWYHLGLAHYLKGDFKNALKAYVECQKVSKNDDMGVATAHWHYMTLRRLGREKEARKVLEPFAGEIEIIENTDYLKLVKLYRGEIPAETLIKEIGGEAKTLGSSSLGYGLGNWYLYNGDKAKATEIFRKITAGDQWASFGFIAAEAELK